MSWEFGEKRWEGFLKSKDNGSFENSVLLSLQSFLHCHPERSRRAV